MEIFKLFGSIFVDSDEANDSIAKTEKNAEGLASKLVAGIKTASKWGAGLAAGAGVAFGGMVALLGKTLETTAEISKFAQVAGMSTDGFQKWNYVMKNFGFSVEQASGDLAALAEKAMDSQSGVGENAEIFKELGVNVEDASGKLKTQEQLFDEVILGLQGMEDVTRRNAIATALLSTTGEELAPVLNMTSEELAKMKSEANVIDDAQLKKAEDFRLGWEKVKTTFSAVLTEVGIRLMPMFQGLVDWISANMPTIQLVIDTVFTALSTGIQIGIQWIQNFIGAIKQWYVDNEATISAIFNAIIIGIQTFITAIQQWYTDNEATFKAFAKIVEDTFNWIVDVWNTVLQPALMTIIQVIMNDLLPAFQTGFKTIQDVVQTTFDLIKTVWINILQPVFNTIMNIIKTVVLPTFQTVFTAIGEAVSTSFNAISGFWNNSLKPILNGITTFISGVFSGNWEKAWSGVVSTFTGIFNGVSTAVKTPLNAVISMINTVISGLNSLSIEIPWWVPGIGSEKWGVNIPKIPMLAKGTDYFKGGLAIVGEKGPELVEMPTGAKVHPNNKTQQMLGQQTPQFIVIRNVMDSEILSESIVDIISGKQYENMSIDAFMKGVDMG